MRGGLRPRRSSARRRPRGARSARSGLLCLIVLAAFAAPATAAPTINVQIVGGTFAAPGQFPFMATLIQASARTAQDGFFCGGSVIAPRVILTAAHCLEGDVPPEAVDVVVGRTRLSSRLTGGRVDVSGIVLHPGYDPQSAANDIALIQLARPVAVPTIRLPGPDDAPSGLPPTRLTTSGWGLTSEQGSEASDALRYVKLTTRPSDPCSALYPAFDGETQVCAGSPRAGEDSCQGDSGGPLFETTSSGYVQLGTVSWGRGCAQKGYPGVYGELNYSVIRNWVTTTAGV